MGLDTMRGFVGCYQQFDDIICLPISRIETIWNETIDLRRVKYIQENDTAFVEKYSLKKDDILFSHINSDIHLGKTAIFKNQTKTLIHGINLLLIRLNKEALADFFNYQFRYKRRRGEFISIAQKSVNQSSINQPKLKNVDFVLPPKPTQQAIVSKIEELFSELDKGIEQLKAAQQQLKTYRQSVLESAFKGLFTQDWRTKHSSKKSAEQIIRKVLNEKEKSAKNNGFKLPPITVVDEEELSLLPDLPETWTWITPDEISSPEKYSIGIGPFGSNLKVSDYKAEGVPLVFVKNITRNNFTLDLKFISEDKFKELIAHAIKPLDIVITKMGDPPGDCTIYPENRPSAVITSDCLKFRVWDKFSNRKYFKYCIETNIIKKQLGLRTKGVAQKKISSSRFKTILFPFTEIEEQDEIVRQIESRLSVADKMEESITQSLQKAEAPVLSVGTPRSFSQ